MIIGSEQCEDGNNTDMDGCFNYRGCSSSDFSNGKCLSCEIPGYQPYEYYCRNICGDGIIVNGLYGYYSEYCDDGNTNNSDKCNSSCSYCATGYSRSPLKICEPVCRDSILVNNELCESGKILPYRGCQNCKPKCQNSCVNYDIIFITHLTYINGKGCKVCDTGYVGLNNVCHSICGDSIVTEDEECDDSNLIYGDGCHFCRFSCVNSCLSCIKGVCYQYEDDQLMDNALSECLSIQGLDMDIDQQICILFSELIQFDLLNIKNCHHKCQICLFKTFYLCEQGYQLSLNKQECIESQIFQVQLQYCKISQGIMCLNCEDYEYFDIVEDICKLQSFTLNLTQNCDYGYHLDSNLKCVSKCGDGILTREEECEIQDENCLYCIYQKPQGCNYFYKDHGLKCQLGFQYDFMTKSCQNYQENEYIDFLNCEIKLSDGCLTCHYGICLECEQNYFLINGFCKDIQTSQEIEIYYININEINDESSVMWLKL